MQTQKNNTGKKLSRIMCLDMYLMSLSWDEYTQLQSRIEDPRPGQHPLLCWDLAAPSSERGNAEIMHTLCRIAGGADWTKQLPAILTRPYQALVLTDAQRVICWADEGFERMTGYPASFAIGKKPSFLQGTNSCPHKIAYIHKKLEAGRRFRSSLLNYRADGSEYLCGIEVFPLRHQQKITHFLALENEII
ncbi:MAG: PAS domain-containing protein [Bacteroidia bacterium]|nr:PAS domain-containing protein [Bacteroidia bacterium]